jgi:hypothetical protein
VNMNLIDSLANYCIDEIECHAQTLLTAKDVLPKHRSIEFLGLVKSSN